jgi:hypothetical protein
MKKWFAFFVILTAGMLAGEVIAQTPAPPAQQVGGARALNGELRFAYLKPGGAPIISPKELQVLFPGSVVDLTAEHVRQLLSGEKGEEFRSRLEHYIGIYAFTPLTPDTPGSSSVTPVSADPQFLQEVLANLSEGRFAVEIYRGTDCRVVQRQGERALVGDCDVRLDRTLTYHRQHTSLPPTPIGFDINAVLIDPVVPQSGPLAGQGVRIGIITGFTGPVKVNSQGVRERTVIEPCVNIVGEIGPAPEPEPLMVHVEEPPPPPAPPLPPPPAPAPEPVLPLFTHVRFFKVFLGRGEELQDPPRGAERDILFTAVADGQNYPVQLVGRKEFWFADERGRSHKGQRLEYLVPDIRHTDEVLLEIREAEVPRGWVDQTRSLNLLIPQDGDWLSPVAAHGSASLGEPLRPRKTLSRTSYLGLGSHWCFSHNCDHIHPEG